jgi:hypothetical protein
LISRFQFCIIYSGAISFATDDIIFHPEFKKQFPGVASGKPGNCPQDFTASISFCPPGLPDFFYRACRATAE